MIKSKRIFCGARRRLCICGKIRAVQGTLNAKWFSVSWQVSAAFEGYKGAVPSRRFAIPSTVLSSCPVFFVKTCSMPADTVPQCVSHAGNSTNPSP